MYILKHLPDPLTISDFQFECLMILLSAALLLPAAFTLYLLHLTSQIESAKTETQEP